MEQQWALLQFLQAYLTHDGFITSVAKKLHGLACGFSVLA
jgi:DNA-binding PucR family transcriptional regulator